MNLSNFVSPAFQKLKHLKIVSSTGLLLYIVILLVVLIIYGEVQNRSVLLGFKEVVAGLNTDSSQLMRSVENLEKENEYLKNEDLRKQINSYDNAVEKYEMVKEKSKEYESQGVDVNSVKKKFNTVVDLIFSKKYSQVDGLLTDLGKQLDKLLKDKQIADAAKKAQPKTTTSTSLPSSGYGQ